MSSNFLNRRMDLFHRILDGYNVFEMDTSYPVKLAGKVIKLFDAGAIYDPTMGYKLINTDREVMLTVSPENVYDFAGRVIKDNIGDDKPYSVPADVYQQGDYVMAILDFDTSRLLLCSQTNFSNLIGGSEGSVKIYNITGNTTPTDTDENFDYKFDPDEFHKAANFESIDGKSALTKFSDDHVLYEVPKEITDTEHPTQVGSRTMTPVAKINVLDINRLTAVVNKYMFGYMDSISSDKSGTEYINKLAAFVQFSGSVNGNFINNFAISESDMLNLPLVTSAPAKIKNELLEEYYNLDANHRSNYMYILMAKVNADDYTLDYYENNMHFVPINPETGTFPSLFELYNRGFVVNGESVDLPSNTVIYGRNFGQAEHNDCRDCYCIYYYTGSVGQEINLVQYDDNNECEQIKSYTSSLFNLYLPANAPSVPIIKKYKLDIEDFASYLYPATKFLKFFVADSIEPYDEVINSLRKHILSFTSTSVATNYPNQSDRDPVTHAIDMDGTKYLANTIIMEYPEIFDTFLDGTTTVLDYDLSGTIPNFNRSFVRYNRVSPRHHNHIMHMVYKLFNTKQTSASYIFDYEEQTLKTANMCFTEDEEETPTPTNYKFTATRCLSDSDNSINLGLYTCTNSNFGMLLTAPLTLLSVNAFGVNNIIGGVPEVTASNFFVVKEIKRTKGYIKILASGNMTITIDDTTYNLYVVTPVSSGEDTTGLPIYTNAGGDTYVYKQADVSDTYINFAKSGTNWRGNYLYMYYTDNSNRVHRIKYHYNNIGEINPDNEYDYFTDNIVIDTSNISLNNPTVDGLLSLNNLNNHNAYLRAAINVEAVNNHNGDSMSAATEIYSWSTTSWGKVIACVAAEYDLDLCTTPHTYSGAFDELTPYKASYLNTSSKINLTVDIDEKIVYGGKDNSSQIYGNEGIRMSDMFSSDISIHKNMMVPLVSNTTDAYGGKVYNVKSYLDYMSKIGMGGINQFTDYNIHKELNVVGINQDIVNTNVLSFYQTALKRDLSAFNNESYNAFDEVEPAYRTMIRKAHIDDVTIKLVYDSANQKDRWAFYENNGTDRTYFSSRGTGNVIFHTNINPKNLFDLNFISLHTVNNSGGSIDVTNDYANAQDKILITEIMTGKRKSYNLSMTDSEDILNPSIVSINGLDDTVSTDLLSWNTLLLSLSNNKSIDMLSTSLRAIKSKINNNITDACQNISDTITMEENKVTVTAAADTTDPFPSGHPEYDKYRQPPGTPAGEFNNELNIYDFHFGYGYVGTIFNKHRIPNNRGVIVFTTENGDSYMEQGSGYTYDKYNNRPSDIHPKRMYINNDGVLCTKEYFDREEAIYSDTTKYPEGYPPATSIAELHEIISNLTTQVTDLTSRLEAIEQELHPNP